MARSVSAGTSRSRQLYQRSGLVKSLEQTIENMEFGLVLPTGDNYPHKGRPVAGSYEFNPATQTVEVIVEFRNPSIVDTRRIGCLPTQLLPFAIQLPRMALN